MPRYAQYGLNAVLAAMPYGLKCFVRTIRPSEPVYGLVTLSLDVRDDRGRTWTIEGTPIPSRHAEQVIFDAFLANLEIDLRELLVLFDPSHITIEVPSTVRNEFDVTTFNGQTNVHAWIRSGSAMTGVDWNVPEDSVDAVSHQVATRRVEPEPEPEPVTLRKYRVMTFDDDDI